MEPRGEQRSPRAMRLPFQKLGEALRTSVRCTETFPLLEDGIKRRKPAPVPDAVG